MDKTEVNIGFDIGISSVGWSVVATKSGRILESGVSLFSGASAAKNEERRNFRQSRRLLRRRKNRISDLKKYLTEQGFTYNEKLINENPYEIRVKGLTEKLSKEEIATALLHIVKRRGVSYDLGDIEEEGTTGSYKEGVKKNQKLLEEKTPAEIQLQRLKNFHKVRGQIIIDENDVLLNVFPNHAYVDEAKQILAVQQEFYPEIDEEFINRVTDFISRKRDYFIGPGSEKSRTDYGIYRTDGTMLQNLFSILIGKDKIFPNEFRAAGNSYTAQIYNLLNDLNNLAIDDTETGKLTKQQKEKIITELKTTEKNVNMMKLIAKTAGVTVEQISRYRINRDGKPEIHNMAVYRKIRKVFLELGYEINEWPEQLLDDLGDALSLNTENGEIRRILTDNLANKYTILDQQLINLIIENKNAFTLSTNQKWHRFSYKTMKILIPELLETNKEQMTILTEMGLMKKDQRNYAGKNKIDSEALLENLYNPVVRKSTRQTMKLFNTLLKKYPNIAYVVIEMPREDDEDKARRDYVKFQKDNEKEKDAALKNFILESGKSEAEVIAKYRQSKKFRSKVRLWYQQMGRCLYSGKAMPAERVFRDDRFTDIDHVIPLSVSFDDGMNNKVLCLAEMNRQKDKQTPYAFFNAGHGQGFQAMAAMLKNNNRISSAKKRNLLFTENLNDLEVRKRFIERNLVDTRYASRVVLNELQQFVKAKQLDTKVTVIRGKFTSKLREKWNINKSRDTHHHHAIDAAVIAVSPMLNLWEKGASIIPNKVGENVIDIKTGEIITDHDYEADVYELPYAKFLEQLPKVKKDIKFRHQVDKKKNRKVSDATIYTTRKAKVGKDKEETDYVLGTIKDIYSLEGYVSFKKIYNKDKTKFLMARIDPKTFEKLEKIVAEYPESIEVVQDNGKVDVQKISPFELYRKDNGFVTKFAKKNNGPAVKSLKYYDSKLGSSIDITPDNAKNKKVVLQSLKPWRTDVYFNEENQEYEIMGLKYSDLKFGKNGKYGVPKVRYEEIKQEEGVSEESKFQYSLYRNSRIRAIGEDGKEIELLFGSRTMPKQRGYVEFKPVTKSLFQPNEDVGPYGKVNNSARCQKKFSIPNVKILKLNTDELGNTYIENGEKEPSDILDM